MRLIIKLFSDKPSRIAVHYENQHQAWKEFESMLEVQSASKYKAVFEIIPEGVNLTLKADEGKARFEYKELTYNPEELKKMQYYLKPGSSIEFVHVYGDNDHLYVAKPIARPIQSLTISGFEIILPDY